MEPRLYEACCANQPRLHTQTTFVSGRAGPPALMMTALCPHALSQRVCGGTEQLPVLLASLLCWLLPGLPYEY